MFSLHMQKGTKMHNCKHTHCCILFWRWDVGISHDCFVLFFTRSSLLDSWLRIVIPSIDLESSVSLSAHTHTHAHTHTRTHTHAHAHTHANINLSNLHINNQTAKHRWSPSGVEAVFWECHASMLLFLAVDNQICQAAASPHFEVQPPCMPTCRCTYAHKRKWVRGIYYCKKNIQPKYRPWTSSLSTSCWPIWSLVQQWQQKHKCHY